MPQADDRTVEEDDEMDDGVDCRDGNRQDVGLGRYDHSPLGVRGVRGVEGVEEDDEGIRAASTESGIPVWLHSSKLTRRPPIRTSTDVLMERGVENGDPSS